MKTIAIIQARMSSTRFPGKVLADLDGLPLVVFMARRVARCAQLDNVILATSDRPDDDALAQTAMAHGLAVFRGSLEDVLGRFAMVQAEHSADVILRMTGDCPLADPTVIGQLVALRHDQNADYASNVAPRSYPHGLDCEIFTAQALARAQANARDAYDREHVTPWMRSQDAGLIRANLAQSRDVSKMRLTVDHPEDLEVVRAVVAGTGPDVGLDDITNWIDAHPEVAALNSAHKII
ncbi:MAG: NTP transferase domain-containing protein [Sedimentitalea sp.]